ncbi:LamG-like jellyroll fold domain-containing protein [Pontibacter kalidii]|uniref:LamG-like jellyroll fold domain-containing protein n=1 Tax=Pontibacter kalidii TaxID=2592049 RepID=UPI002253B058|nr:LamG-like jellyroll fold domain-containing protein [Pontibacter kalidii]
MSKFIYLAACVLLISFKLTAQSSVIPFKSTWKYLDNGTNQGTSWRDVSFDDATWKTGNGKLGYGISDAATVVSYGGKSNSKYITTYFRKSITIADAALFSSYQAKVNRDDGVIVYVNGVEVYRNNMPSGTISYTTLAAGTSGGDDGATPIPFTITASAFRSGVNTVAVEIHQASLTSSDIAFDLELLATGVTAPTNQPPIVQIESPTNNTSYTLGQDVQITASASDPEGSLAKVEFFANDTKVGEDASSPYSISWNPTSVGTYQLSAKATDGAGASTPSTGISVTITSATPVDQTAPAVLSINRQSPTTSITEATNITFRTTFSEPVTGVDRGDFNLTEVSGSVTGILSPDAVAAVGTAGSTYDVTVNSVSGNGVLRLDLKSNETGIADTAGNAISSGYTAGQTYTIEQDLTGEEPTDPAPPQAKGFASLVRLNPVPISTSTGEKPQSKVWTYDGKHWAVLPNSSGTYLWRLDGTSWTNVLKLSSRTTTKADCKLVNNIAHILLYQGPSSQMASVEYVPSLGTYKLWSRRTSTVGLSLDTGVETATIDIDSEGRMWVASAGVSDVNVRWSDAPYSNWSAPVTIATGVKDDDICAVIALPKSKKIGVLWSNQNTKRFGFKTHSDGAAPSDWSADEAPAANEALEVGNGMADDHMNMAVGSDGTLYCAVKTSYDINGYPKLILLVRRLSGNWDPLYEVSPNGTRPIVILNETNSKFRIVYSSQEYGGDILYRESSTSNILLSTQLTLIKGGTYDNSTSTKANFNTDVVILASSSTEAVGVLASDGTIESVPSVPVLASPTNGATGVESAPTLGWNSASGATSYQVQVSSVADFSSVIFDDGTTNTSVDISGLAFNTSYFWRVKGINADGSSSWSSAWSFKTSSAPTNTLVGHWKMEEASGTTLLDASEYKNHATTVGNPTWTGGVVGQALQLNGSSQYATVPDNTSLDITGSITLAAWIKPEKVATQYLLKKATQSGTNGYELSLSNAGKVFFRFNQASSGDMYRQNSVASYPTDGTTWMHVAATYDGTVINIYINGKLNSYKTLSAPSSINVNALALGIGAQSDGGSKFQGAIDDARVYNTALSASQIMELTTVSPSMLASASSASFVILPEEGVQGKLAVFPNPYQTQATITFSLVKDGDYVLMLNDSKGMQIAELKRGRAIAGEQYQTIIDRATLSVGMYIIRLQTNQGTKSIKLLLSN